MPTDIDFDLDKLLMPAWARQEQDTNRYERFTGNEGAAPRRGDRGDRRDRPPRPMPGRDRSGPRPPRGPEGPRRDGPRPQGQGRPFRGRPEGGRGGRPQRPEREFTPEPLPEVNVSFVPDDTGVQSMTRQIKMTGRAYPLFQIAHMILERPERHSVTLSAKKNADGGAAQPLFQCALDDSVWLSEQAAVAHVLDRHFATFYQPERTPTDPPKGTYTFVAQCGMSGAILGPPNYHDYQNHLRRLHAEKFSRMPFEAFKARVKIVKDEAVVKQWVEEQSWKTEYNCLNVPEPRKLATRGEVEKHFRETHLATIIRPAETVRLPGPASRQLRDRGLARLVRLRWEEQRRFPMQVATVLSQQFASHGLQFFKVQKSVTHVSVARPRHLDLETMPVSEGIRRIVEFIQAHPKCTHKKLVEALVPRLIAPVAPVAPVGDGQPAPAADGSAAPPAPPEPTPEMAAVMSDLHWLVHQGHVIDFSNGFLEVARKPPPRPPKPEPAQPAHAATAATPVAVTTETATAPGETTQAPSLAGEAFSAPPPPPEETPAPAAAEPAASPGEAGVNPADYPQPS
jgi:hypothetical protein